MPVIYNIIKNANDVLFWTIDVAVRLCRGHRAETAGRWKRLPRWSPHTRRRCSHPSHRRQARGHARAHGTQGPELWLRRKSCLYHRKQAASVAVELLTTPDAI